MPSLNHPILNQSFAVIDREIGVHSFTPEEYAIVRRVIHSTADFEFKDLIRFSPGAIEAAITALQQRVPIVTDVSMVKQGITTLVEKTFQNPILSAVEQAPEALPGKTRTETGMLHCWQQAPQAIYVIGNAPTALLALCDIWRSTDVAATKAVESEGCERTHASIGFSHTLYPNQPFDCYPSSTSLLSTGTSPILAIGAPVGFISVMESKAALAQTPVPQIRVEGRKGGSPVAAAIVNALLVLAWERSAKKQSSEAVKP